MSTLTFRPVKNIGYNAPVGINVEDFEYCKFDNKEVELDDNEICAPSDNECEEDTDDDDAASESVMTIDDSCSENSEECDFSVIIKHRRRVTEKVYSVVLQEEEFLPE